MVSLNSAGFANCLLSPSFDLRGDPEFTFGHYDLLRFITRDLPGALFRPSQWALSGFSREWNFGDQHNNTGHFRFRRGLFGASDFQRVSVGAHLYGASRDFAGRTIFLLYLAGFWMADQIPFLSGFYPPAPLPLPSNPDRTHLLRANQRFGPFKKNASGCVI